MPNFCDVVLPDVLNDDVVGVIKEFLPPEKKVWLSKADYLENHSVVKTMIPVGRYNDYILDMVKHDCSFVFKQILQEQFDKFHKWKDFRICGREYRSYLVYLMDTCIDHCSVGCIDVINEIAKTKGFSGNWYKRSPKIIPSTSAGIPTSIY